MNFVCNNNLICTLVILIYLSCYSQHKPNVIIIYTDDQGAIDLGCYGALDIYSPNIDKLAKEGTRFTQSYVAAPVCAPSRAALLTGNYPQNAGVYGNTSHVPNSHGMPKAQYTLAELFKDNGYKTGHIGKWHLGMSAETSPNAQGFDYSFGHLRGCIDNYSHYFYWAGPNVHDLYENGKEVFYDGIYFPDLASDKALQYIEDHKTDAFFMYYAINMPHYPYQPTAKWRDYYKTIEKPRGDYAAFISTIDERIGFLIDKLENLGIRDNTIIIYQSDNGHSTETRAFNGGGNPGPYRGAKSSLFEGGIRLPTIISWKNNLPENTVNNQFIMNTDWLPTLASLCDLKNIPQDIDGLDMSGMIAGKQTISPRDSGFWKYGTQWAVRNGNWKLMGYPKDTSNKGQLNPEFDTLFLSNLKDDVSEMTNLAAKYPEVVEKLKTKYLAWKHGYEADIPTKSKPINHLGRNASINAISPLHNRYKNVEVLLDGKRGYADYSSGQWIGQEGNDLEFILDLEEIKPVSKITVGYLHNPSNWVFSPKYFEVAFSNDGVTFNKHLSSENSTRTLDKKNFTDTLSVASKQKSRYIKLTIKTVGNVPEGHAAVGNPAWFFIDEIIIE